MLSITERFEVVSVKRIRKGKCTKCGERCQVTRRFFQTLNPFNLNANGLPKSASEIRAEETAKADAWHLYTPLVCRSCEPNP